MSLLATLMNEGAVLSGITADSRQVVPGSLFLAYPGEQGDGRDYIEQALSLGAAAVIWEQQDYAWNPQWDLPNLSVSGLRAQAGFIADGFYSRPSSHLWMIGVTGTNGKTSCSHWLAQALTALGRKSSVIGTLGNGFAGNAESAQHPLSAAINTTPDPIVLHGMLADYLAQGAKVAVMEVSSHGLQQGRTNGVHFDVAVFTNLSRDHLDYHGDMQAYANAKRKLFDWDGLRCAVLNVDDDFGRQVAQELAEQGREVLSYGLQSGDVRGSQLTFSGQGLSMQVSTPFGEAYLTAPVTGRFNAYNLLAVLASLLVSEVKLTDAILAIGQLKPVAGRMQVYGGDNLPLVVVDYAHTPDALQNVLSTLREQLEQGKSGGRLVCVFGCGGDRDNGKRPLMGQVAVTLADQVVITTDNPRHEQPQAIIDAILAGLPASAQAGYSVQPERAAAIAQAIAAARAGDIVLVAGKGHEDYQDIAGVKHPFSDSAMVQASLQRWPS